MTGEGWENFLTVLQQTLDLYRALLRLSIHKRDVLVAADASMLERMTQQEEVLVLQVARMENLRKPLAAQLAREYGLAPDELTISKACELAPVPVADRLTAIRKEFETVSDELVPLNRSNARLIEQALTFVNYNVNLLARNTAGTTYAPQGKTSQGAARVMIDQKA